jgi:hypothetical protein
MKQTEGINEVARGKKGMVTIAEYRKLMNDQESADE